MLLPYQRVIFVAVLFLIPTSALVTGMLWRRREARFRIELSSNKEQLLQMRQAVEQCPASIIITDTRGKIEYVNPKFCALTGYSFEEALGKNPRMLKSGEMPPEGYRRLWETLQAGQEWRGEFHNKKKNGEMYWELASISAIRDTSGAIKHFMAVKEDITERKQAEAALREAMAKVKTLSGLIPICAGCKKIRDDHGYWNQVEAFVAAHSDAKFSHGLCPDCAQRLGYPALRKKAGV